MGRKQFTEEQIAFALRQHDSGTAVAEIIRKLGMSPNAKDISQSSAMIPVGIDGPSYCYNRIMGWRTKLLIGSALGAGLRTSLKPGGPKNVGKAVRREGRRLMGKLVLAVLAGAVVGTGVGIAAGLALVGILAGLGASFLTLVVLLLV